MSAFKALNVDSDQESEDEVDNTKEIQIEETLKLYQTALKLHSEGLPSFEKAAEAYKALFESEIFKYPESLSEYKRHELYGDSLVFDTILDDIDSDPIQPATTNDSAPNTLHQILHLSYKNHGQFLLETMQHWIREHGRGAIAENRRSSHVLGALDCFAESLDKDDVDLDLWLRTASVAALLGSKRITRFCLEAVLDGDDELMSSILRLPGLQEGFAGQQLRELVEKLEDTLSLMQRPLSSMSRKRLSETLKKRLNPYRFAPLPSEVAESVSLGAVAAASPRTVLTPSKWDWAAVGEAILHQFHAEQGGFVTSPLGSAITINVPHNAKNADEPGSNISLLNDQSPADVTDGPSQRTTSDDDAALPEEAAVNLEEDRDAAMTDLHKESPVTNEEGNAAPPQDHGLSQSRKRSTDSAGFPETAEGGRSRSKRIRARDSVADGAVGPDTIATDAAKQLEEKLYPFAHADKCLFEIINDSLERLGIEGMGSSQELRELLSDPQLDNVAAGGMDIAACDYYRALQGGTTKTAGVMLNNEPVDLGAMTREAGLNAFLGYAKTNNSKFSTRPLLVDEQLLAFASHINNQWLSVKEAAFSWLEALLGPGALAGPDASYKDTRSSYEQYRWPEDLKRHLVQVLVNFDESIYETLLGRINALDIAILKARAESTCYELSKWDAAQIEIVQIIFELHLDVYSLIRHPHSGVDSLTQTSQNDRLQRWSILARTALHLRSNCNLGNGLDHLALRHIWASVFQLGVDDDVPPQLVIRAMEELKALFRSREGPVIEVQNNAVMPELSIAAVDRELTRISMKDFFLKVFEQEGTDPVAIIESLEPILDCCVQSRKTGESDDSEALRGHRTNSGDSSTLVCMGESNEAPLEDSAPSYEISSFLETASVHLKLSLWQRLREAYEAIEYLPKVVSCYLRSIETLVADFKSSSYTDSATLERQMMVLSRLRIIDEIVIRVLQLIKEDKSAFDCLSYEHVQTSLKALADLLRLLSAGNILEDMVRVGHVPAPRFEGLHHSAFLTITTRLHDIQLRAWMLQYHLLKEGIAQNPAAFPTPSEEQFEFLRHVHYATGVRNFCHMANRNFLRLAKDEVLRLEDVIDGNTRDNELAQVLYDLYGLKVFAQPTECHEFYSSTEVLDKRTALQLLSFIQAQARKSGIKDLSKTDLKVSIDKVHGALGRPRTNEDISHNRKILTTYFKSPINPLALFECLKGVGTLSTKAIPSEVAVPASKGWYFLMGNIALNKFRSQKRLTPGPTEDLNFAQAFFLQDLEYSIDQWETWYRLAQVYDSQLEEAVSWTAEKLNSNSVELINYQRGAINCYTLATACAVRDADVAPQTLSKISDLYADFGNRVYSSSREPFCMNAFDFRDTEKKYCSGSHVPLYQNIPFPPLQMYTAWKFASALFKRAIRGKPDKWWTHYMLAKCLWKMYCFNANLAFEAAQRDETPPSSKGPSREEVIAAVVNAINAIPEKRERGREPILEPHYKLVAIVHKLLKRKEIDHREGEKILQNTPYSQNISGPESADDWEGYILKVMKALKTADKSSWHHRMLIRTALIIYESDPDDPVVARGAKHELTQQMFTKTMSVQVWKPEYERPGRHFVYTSRYTRLFVRLLEQTKDKANMELLIRRVRRKQLDFYKHSDLWTELCTRYLGALRGIGGIPQGHEDTIFKSVNLDEFAVQANRLEEYCKSVTAPDPVLETMRDATELKRINNGLMKTAAIDDLIGDTYALLYETFAPRLPPLSSEQIQQPQQALQNVNLLGQFASSSQHVPTLSHQLDGAPDARIGSNPPFSIYSTNSSIQSNPIARSRQKAVPRREIMRRAEAASLKPIVLAATSTVMAFRSPVQTHPHPDVPNVPEADEPTRPGSPQIKMDEESQGLPSGVPTRRTSNVDGEARLPFTLHVGDEEEEDESELSELDESEVREIQEECDIHDPVARVRDEEGLPDAEDMQEGAD